VPLVYWSEGDHLMTILSTLVWLSWSVSS